MLFFLCVCLCVCACVCVYYSPVHSPYSQQRSQCKRKEQPAHSQVQRPQDHSAQKTLRTVAMGLYVLRTESPSHITSWPTISSGEHSVGTMTSRCRQDIAGAVIRMYVGCVCTLYSECFCSSVCMCQSVRLCVCTRTFQSVSIHCAAEGSAVIRDTTTPIEAPNE